MMQVHSAVAQQLWQIVVVDANLPLHLKAIKDYLLLGRGTYLHRADISYI